MWVFTTIVVVAVGLAWITAGWLFSQFPASGHSCCVIANGDASCSITTAICTVTMASYSTAPLHTVACGARFAGSIIQGINGGVAASNISPNGGTAIGTCAFGSTVGTKGSQISGDFLLSNGQSASFVGLWS